MIKSKRLRKKEDSQDEFDIDDIVDSQDQDYENTKILSNQKLKQNQLSNQKNSSLVNKNEKSQQKIIPSGSKLTIQQIKNYIETQIPQMKQQIAEMDDESLRQIYQSVNQTNTKQDTQQQTKTNNIQNLQSQKQIQQNQNTFQSKSIKRNPQIQFMLDEIIKNVPHMKDQVEIFNDNQIRQLYQTVSGCQNNQSQPTKDGYCPKISNAGMHIQQIKKFVSQKIPSMKNQLNYLSNEDILQVYQKYAQKDKSLPQSKPTNYSFPSGYSNQYNPSHLRTATKNSYQPYDSSKNYPTNMKNSVKLQPRSNYGPDQQQRYYGEFNNYKYGNGNQRIHSPIIDGNIYLNSNYNSDYNNVQVHTFHNNQKVSNFPYNQQKFARTVVIFHTMDPGYIPPIQKSNCRCPCCIKRQSSMHDENPLNSFIFEMMKKYSSKK